MIKTKKQKKTNEENGQTQPPKGVLRENIEAIIIALILALFIRTFFIQAFKIPTGSMLETLQIGDHILVNKFIYGVKVPFLRKTLIPVKDPERGDIVVFIYPIDKRDFIKRVIGVEGDKIEIRNKKVYLNDRPVPTESYKKTGKSSIRPCGIKKGKFEETWLKELEFQMENYQTRGRFDTPPCLRDNFGPITVPKDSLFVMGDNRDHSHDSRFWGFVPLSAVKGKAMIIYWSWDSTVEKSMGDRLMFWKWVRWNRIGDLLK